MKAPLACAVLAAALLSCLACASVWTVPIAGRSVRVPAGCDDHPEQGIDTAVGSVRCAGHPEIAYDIGDLAGNSCRDPANRQAITTASGIHCVTCVDDSTSKAPRMYVWCPPANFWARVKSDADRQHLLDVATAWSAAAPRGGTQ